PQRDRSERRQSPVARAFETLVLRIVGVSFDADGVEELFSVVFLDLPGDDGADGQGLGLVLLLDVIRSAVEAQPIIGDADHGTVRRDDDYDAFGVQILLHYV